MQPLPIIYSRVSLSDTNGYQGDAGCNDCFPRFPVAWPGLGLLLLRAAGWLAVASGALLLIGILTPAAGILVALGAIGVALSWFPAPASNLFDAKLPTGAGGGCGRRYNFPGTRGAIARRALVRAPRDYHPASISSVGSSAGELMLSARGLLNTTSNSTRP